MVRQVQPLTWAGPSSWCIKLVRQVGTSSWCIKFAVKTASSCTKKRKPLVHRVGASIWHIELVRQVGASSFGAHVNEPSCFLAPRQLGWSSLCIKLHQVGASSWCIKLMHQVGASSGCISLGFGRLNALIRKQAFWFDGHAGAPDEFQKNR